MSDDEKTTDKVVKLFPGKKLSRPIETEPPEELEADEYEVNEVVSDILKYVQNDEVEDIVVLMRFKDNQKGLFYSTQTSEQLAYLSRVLDVRVSESIRKELERHSGAVPNNE